MRAKRLFALAMAAMVLLPSSACTRILLYDITAAPAEQCEIRRNGEFCDEEDQLEGWVYTTITVELGDASTTVYFDDRVFIADGVSGQRQAGDDSKSIRDTCTTTHEYTLSFDEDTETFNGSYETRVRTDGPAGDCGDTPFGERTRATLSGERGQGI